MNWFQRVITRIFSRLVPQFGKLIKQSGGTVERLSEQVEMYRALAQIRQDERLQLQAEYREALSMSGAGPWLQTPAGVRESKTNLTESRAAVALKERLWDLELAFEDMGWQREVAQSSLEFSRWGVQQIILICRLFRIKNPLVQRGILISSYYVFGRGFEISSPDETTNEVLNRFFENPANRSELGMAALTEKEQALYTDGNIFWALFTDQASGDVLTRSIDATEIIQIVSDPDDSSKPRFYQRNWVEQTFNVSNGSTEARSRTLWYLDADYEPIGKIERIGAAEIAKSAGGEYIRIIHQKSGGLMKWQYGCPRAYAAIDWARAYKQRLEDYASITRALARFAWDVKTKGGAPAIAALKGSFATTLVNDGSMQEQNPPPVTGSSFISGPNETITPVKTAGVAPNPEEGRRLAHMVYMVFGLGEHFFADIASGNLATAKTLDRPTELKFVHDQLVWKETFRRLALFVLDRSAKAPSGKMREAKKETQAEPIVNVEFPAIIEGDIPEQVDAVVKAMTLGTSDGVCHGIDERQGVGQLLRLVGVPDFDDVLELMYPSEEYEPNRETQAEDRAAASAQTAKLTAPEKKAKEAQLIERVIESLEKWKAAHA